jgi:hypothetical protein
VCFVSLTRSDQKEERVVFLSPKEAGFFPSIQHTQ